MDPCSLRGCPLHQCGGVRRFVVRSVTMPRYLYRVEYIHTDGTSSYEPVCVDAASEADAEAEVDAATERYPAAVGATKTLTLVSTT